MGDEKQPLDSATAPTLAPAKLPDPYLGTKFKERYVIERVLGRGGFGVVYRARDEQLFGRPVVVKVLQESGDGDAWFTKKFFAEQEALSRIDHPGVVGVLDSGNGPDGRPFLVMQFVEGVTLRQAMGKEPIALERAGRILRQLGQALTAAHDRGICHRDLKPENVMLQDLGHGDENVKIIDFGIATVREAAEGGETHTGTRVAGSGPYMAPEQLLALPTKGSDIYALGVMAYEMLTAQRPFQFEALAQLYLMQKEGVKVKPRELRAEVPEAAEAEILRALEFEEKNRPKSAREFGEEMAGALAGKAMTPAAKAEPKPQPKSGGVPALEVAFVLFMDIVGYSLERTDRQTELVGRLEEVVFGTEAYRAAQERGEVVVQPSGDGMALVFFGRPEAPADCAVEIARALKGDATLRLRMGINSGAANRVVDAVGHVNITGDGINLAQRVMSCGDAGHILVSRSVAEVLGQVSQWAPRLHNLGDCKVKHGVAIHLYNLYTEEAGNPGKPAKMRGPGRRTVVALVVAASAVAALAVTSQVAGWVSRYLGGPERVLNYSITVQKPDGSQFRLPGEINFEAGYGIRLAISSPQTGHLYVINEPPENAGAPAYIVLDAGTRVEAGQIVNIPRMEGNFIRFDKQAGTERAWMVWSDQQVPELDVLRKFATAEYAGAVKEPVAAQAVKAFLDKYRTRPPAADKGPLNTTVRAKGKILVYLLKLLHY